MYMAYAIQTLSVSADHKMNPPSKMEHPDKIHKSHRSNCLLFKNPAANALKAPDRVSMPVENFRFKFHAFQFLFHLYLQQHRYKRFLYPDLSVATVTERSFAPVWYGLFRDYKNTLTVTQSRLQYCIVLPEENHTLPTPTKSSIVLQSCSSKKS